MLGRIRPRSKDEAMDVLRWLLDTKHEQADQNADAILLNLIG